VNHFLSIDFEVLKEERKRAKGFLLMFRKPEFALRHVLASSVMCLLEGPTQTHPAFTLQLCIS
jgi:hypothetical protein